MLLSLSSVIVHKNKWYYQPLKTKIKSITTDNRQGVGVVGFYSAFMIVFTGCMKHGKGGSSRLGLFGILLQIPTEVTSPDIADTTKACYFMDAYI